VCTIPGYCVKYKQRQGCPRFWQSPFMEEQGIHTHLCARTYTHAHTHIHMQAHTQAHTHSTMHTRTHTHTHTRIYTHVLHRQRAMGSANFPASHSFTCRLDTNCFHNMQTRSIFGNGTRRVRAFQVQAGDLPLQSTPEIV
jgi:hypothetical protein